MSERPDSDKPAVSGTSTTTSKPAEPPKPAEPSKPQPTDHPTTAEKPGTGGPVTKKKEPPRRGEPPEKAFPYGYVRHPDGYVIGRREDGMTYMWNPKDETYGHWDGEGWRDPETGDRRPEGWGGGHDGMLNLQPGTSGWVQGPGT